MLSDVVPDKSSVTTCSSSGLRLQYPTQTATPSPPSPGPPVDSSNDVLVSVEAASGVRQYVPGPVLDTERQPTSPSA